MLGDTDWQTLTWARLLPLVANTPYPPRPARNDTITMASLANDLVAFHARALPGELFRYPETLAAFRAVLPTGVTSPIHPRPLCSRFDTAPAKPLAVRRGLAC